jgi:hypothetical protein
MARVRLEYKGGHLQCFLNGKRLKRISWEEAGYRTVFQSARRVVKVEHKNITIPQCVHEYTTWLRTPKHLKKWLVPTIAFGETNNHFYTVQPRVEIVQETTREIAKKARKVVKKLGIQDCFPKADYMHNWTVKDGKPLIFDYGC